MTVKKKRPQGQVLIIGAGPAGLTAALEVLDKTDLYPVIIEQSSSVGGLSRTVRYKQNRLDIGGHRFFSKSPEIMAWWQKILPLCSGDEEACLMSRRRLSRILFKNKMFDYPLRLSLSLVTNLGLLEVLRIAASYLKAHLKRISPETSLRDFFVNRFGQRLYQHFFADYTAKVWGVSCAEIPPEWGAQRVKGLSLWASLYHALKQFFAPDRSHDQQHVETSLIEQFLYPRLGPGQLWEAVAAQIVERGGQIIQQQRVVGLQRRGDRITEVTTCDADGLCSSYQPQSVMSSMPLRDLAQALGSGLTQEAQNIAQGLVYRDFVTVGLLLRGMKSLFADQVDDWQSRWPDNWIYVQDPRVQLGRVQIFNNWSEHLVADPSCAWLGLEYFCQEGDDLWRLDDDRLISLALHELELLGMADTEMFLDAVVVREPKAYPAYFGSYNKIDDLRSALDPISNLYLIGRNGMHRYNNMDHSMATAMAAVDCLVKGTADKSAIWAVNTEGDYHEEA